MPYIYTLPLICTQTKLSLCHTFFLSELTATLRRFESLSLGNHGNRIS